MATSATSHDDEEDELLPASVPRLHKPSYDAFLPFMVRNMPVMLTGLMENWAAQRWVKDGALDTARLRRVFGECMVPVVEGTGSYGEEKRADMRMDEYLSLWESGEAEERCLYLKDWHHVRDCHRRAGGREEKDGGSDVAAKEEEEEGQAACCYVTPEALRDDWLNDWWDAVSRSGGRRVDDYRFVYLGPRGSMTALHHDVLGSYSWSGNVMGVKRWVLIPPSESLGKLYRHGQLITHDLESEAGQGLKHVRRLEVEQHPGEILFVPSLWHHQVLNVSPGGCLSINHNWFNACSLLRIWSFLESEHESVLSMMQHHRDSFDDQGEWEEHAEVMLRANSALNLTDFLHLLHLQLPPLLIGAEAEDGTACEAGSKCWQLSQVGTVLQGMACLHPDPPAGQVEWQTRQLPPAPWTSAIRARAIAGLRQRVQDSGGDDFLQA